MCWTPNKTPGVPQGQLAIFAKMIVHSRQSLHSPSGTGMTIRPFKHHFSVGEPVIYRVTKQSAHPGPRAQEIYPTPGGEQYTYIVDKFWVVADIEADGRLRLRTRRGKEHVIAPDDPNLRPPHWWERLLHRHRFPKVPV